MQGFRDWVLKLELVYPGDVDKERPADLVTATPTYCANENPPTPESEALRRQRIRREFMRRRMKKK